MARYLEARKLTGYAEIPPQWSPPLSSKTMRHVDDGSLLRVQAAMEPAGERRDDVELVHALAQHLGPAAMEPAG